MRKFGAILFLLMFASLALWAEQKSVDRLKAEAMKASGAEQGKLYAELAEALVNVANEQFSRGDSVKAHATVQELLEDAVKAHDAVLTAKNNRKEVEIHLRNTQRHLEDVKRTLAAEDRPALDAVEKKLADLRQDLLDAMWGSPKKESSK
jgi:hypothetical protein